MSLLESILATKRKEIDSLVSFPRGTRTPLAVLPVLRRGRLDPLRLIAEVKFRSPSAGALSRALDAAGRALAYQRAGAAMVSVLCDGEFFDGGWDHLASVRWHLDRTGASIPVLAKEFVLHRAQVLRAHAAGADSVLLIARIVEPTLLAELVDVSRDLGMEPLVEVADERELDAALGAGALLIGVNARDLDTLGMDEGRAARVVEAIARDRVAVHLSGLRSAVDVARVATGRSDAALLGESLMRQEDPEPLLSTLVLAAGGVTWRG